MGNIALSFLAVLALFFYFIPTMTAVARRHVNAVPVFLTNFLLGMTGIGWAVALIWSFTANVKDATDAAAARKAHGALLLLKVTLALAIFFAITVFWIKGHSLSIMKTSAPSSETKIRTGVPVPADELLGKQEPESK